MCKGTKTGVMRNPETEREVFNSIKEPWFSHRVHGRYKKIRSKNEVRDLTWGSTMAFTAMLYWEKSGQTRWGVMTAAWTKVWVDSEIRESESILGCTLYRACQWSAVGREARRTDSGCLTQLVVALFLKGRVWGNITEEWITSSVFGYSRVEMPERARTSHGGLPLPPLLLRTRSTNNCMLVMSTVTLCHS